MPVNTTLDIQGTILNLTNLDKIFYANGFTKGQVLDYYIRVAPVLLPHVKDRPMTLKRYPHGADGKFFYQKECPANRPTWFNTLPVWSEGRGRPINFCLIDSLAALVWSANMAVLELHPSLSKADNTSIPSALVFDLDPGPPASMTECAEVGLLLRLIFDRYGLESFPKTSGSKGLQVYVPLNTPCSYEQTKSFAHMLAKDLEKHRPDLIVAKMKKDLRKNKVFIDWSQNDEHKTTVSVYSLRAKEKPTVSAPVTWAEVESVYTKRNPLLVEFDCHQVLARLDQHGDLFAAILTKRQQLPSFEEQKWVTKKATRKHTTPRSQGGLSEIYTPESLSATDNY